MHHYACQLLSYIIPVTACCFRCHHDTDTISRGGSRGELEWLMWRHLTLTFDRVIRGVIRVACINLTVLIEQFDFDRLLEASEDGQDLPQLLQWWPNK